VTLVQYSEQLCDVCVPRWRGRYRNPSNVSAVGPASVFDATDPLWTRTLRQIMLRRHSVQESVESVPNRRQHRLHCLPVPCMARFSSVVNRTTTASSLHTNLLRLLLLGLFRVHLVNGPPRSTISTPGEQLLSSRPSPSN